MNGWRRKMVHLQEEEIAFVTKPTKARDLILESDKMM